MKPRKSRAEDEFPTSVHLRRSRLVELVQKRAYVLVSDVAREFQVSEMTIRRDFELLDKQGQLARTHGGARLREPASLYVVDPEEPAFSARLKVNREGKQRIAQAALSLLAGCRTVALDVGTTTHLLAQRMLSRPSLRIFTSSLRTATLLRSNAMEVYIPGGQVSGDEMSVSGPVALAQFERLWFDLAFIGVSGVTTTGYFDYSIEDTEMKKIYLRRSARKVILCDSSKFCRMSLVEVAGLSEANLLLTDAPPPAEIAAALARAKVELLVADGTAAAITSNFSHHTEGR